MSVSVYERGKKFMVHHVVHRFRQLSGFFIRKNKRLCHLSGDWWWGVRLDHFQVWIEGKGLTWFLFCWKNKSTKMNGKQGERVQNTK